MSETEYTFRPYGPSDLPFILSSWAESYYSASKIKDLLSPEEFHRFHRPLRERFLSRATGTIIVATPEDDPNFILGWIAIEVLPNCSLLHYVYTRSLYRREFRLATRLIELALPKGVVLFTHLTPRASKILSMHPEKFSQFRFAPHLT